MYQPRTYRNRSDSSDLVSFIVSIKETNLFVSACCDLKRKTERLVVKYRKIIEQYIAQHPDFLISLKPVETDAHAPNIILDMAIAAKKTGVGPMAAVAGAVAKFVGEELREYTSDVIIENGGDIYICSTKDRVIGIFAGNSPLSGTIGLEIKAGETPCGICTSSGTVGHSLSFGKADAMTIIAASASLADAAATACANIVQTASDIPLALKLAGSTVGVTGAVAIKDAQLGVWGEIKLKKL